MRNLATIEPHALCRSEKSKPHFVDGSLALALSVGPDCMKVVIVSRFPLDPAMPKGGVEAVTIVLLRALHAHPDLDVEVIDVANSVERSRVEILEGIRVHRIARSKWPQLLDILAGPTRKLILEKIAELRPDLVHWHETYGLPAPAQDVPQVYTVHGFDSENVVAESVRFAAVKSLLWCVVERMGYARHRHFISINPYVRDKIQTCSRGKIHEINNPLDRRFFEISRHEERPPRVLCVGWINPRKNTHTSVAAFAQALAAGCEAKLVIAGTAKDPAYMARVSAEIAKHGLENHVEFLGHVGHGRLVQELSRASIFLLPSLQENAPMAIAEAMAVGVPVIVSNRCGMPFMVDHGHNGFLIDPTNARKVGDSLTKLLRNPTQREAFSRHARRTARERYHPDLVVEKTLRAYASILASEQSLSASVAHPHNTMPAANG
jgi:glycosyltransferase involved in cell wall biosynthesis